MVDDLISRQAAIDAVCMEWCNVKHQDCKHPFDVEKDDYYWCDGCETVLRTLPDLPSAQQWNPCNKGLPKKRDWYLGIFKESDTGWINPIPFVCDYLLGKKTKATTKEGWILKGFTDREEHIDYYFNLECVAWMSLHASYCSEGEKK